ncbi:hypothetical protein C8J23_1071 [Shewanella chilikensis]|uniref:Uncharacterized protein n=1 Tax=Shewanella chilikensis TaxID=558541 RepID=A0ABX5PQE8_9GAMM|nr:hypothetical protein C8J23_1071 [Shewanella chilikensis]
MDTASNRIRFGDFFFFREAKQAFGSFRFHGPTISVELPTISSDFNADWYKKPA